ncbi:MAG: hypothetical protein ACE5IZ_02875 [Dehalococcoidia bacterium]
MVEPSQWVIAFDGCADAGQDCRCGYFRVTRVGSQEQRVEVLMTAQEEHLLAMHIGREALSDDQRKAVLEIAGRDLINHCITEHGHLPPTIYVTSRHLFGRPGAQWDLLRRAALL